MRRLLDYRKLQVGETMNWINSVGFKLKIDPIYFKFYTGDINWNSKEDIDNVETYDGIESCTAGFQQWIYYNQWNNVSLNCFCKLWKYFIFQKINWSSD